MKVERIWRHLGIAVVLILALSLPGAVQGEAPGKIAVSYTFPNPEMSHVEGFDRVEIPGLPSHGDPGEPILPFSMAKILLPLGTSVDAVQVVATGEVTLEGQYRIEPGQVPLPTDSEPTCGRTPPDPDIYGSSEPFPGITHQVLSVQFLRGYALLFVRLYPVQYAPALGQVSYYQSMDIQITTKLQAVPDAAAQASMLSADPQDAAQVEGIIDNPELLTGYHDLGQAAVAPSGPIVDPADPYDYVLITNEALRSAFQPLVDWKSSKGLTAEIVTTEEICAQYGGADQPDQIRNFIKHAYTAWARTGHPLRYVTLGGDDEIIPIRYMHRPGYDPKHADIPSDMYYGGLDGTWDANGNGKYGESNECDFFAEVYVGRITVETADEATNLVNKVLAYEQNPTADYLDRSLLIGRAWGCGGSWGDDDTAAMARVMPQYNATALYQRDGTAPYQRDGTFGEDLIVAKMNEGPHLVVASQHGSPNGHPLYADKVDALTNDKYFLFFNNSCSTAAFDMGESWVGYEAVGEHYIFSLHGAFAYIGNTRVGYVGSGRLLGESFFDIAVNSKAHNVGRALQLAKEKLYGSWGECGDILTLILLGDPETPLVTQLASPVADISDPDGGERLQGVVDIYGTAQKGARPDAAAFDHYRLEYGVGPYPSSWTLIGTFRSPVTDGKLAAGWDTDRLRSRVYTLRLLVYDQAGRVSEDRAVVTVDRTKGLLFVADAGGGGTAWFRPYFTRSLDALGYQYDVWDTAVSGPPDGPTLNVYTNLGRGGVLWASPGPGPGYFAQEQVQKDLTAYLEAGGKLFITGQDIGYYAGGTDFYQNSLHAKYVQDNIGRWALNGVPGDPISDGLRLSITGGNGADNQDYPDEIDISQPPPTATLIFAYDPTALRAAGQPEKPDEGLSAHPVEAQQAAGPLGMLSSGGGGLRYTNPEVANEEYCYQVVYLSFGFEAIDNETDRGMTMESALTWLGLDAPLGIPTNLKATAVSSSRIDLGWGYRSWSEEPFEIERSQDGGQTWTWIAEVPADKLDYRDSGLRCNTAYQYRVYRYSSAMDRASPYSHVTSATTKACGGQVQVAVDDRYDAAKDETLYVGAPGVLGNDILANGEPRAYYLADGQQVYEMGWYEDSWHNRHVTEDPRLPLPANNTIAAISANGAPRIYYSSSNGHIHEVSWHAEDDKWHHDLDITRHAGGPAPVPGTLTATTVNGNPRIYYLADDGQAHELAWVVDAWYHRNVTGDAGGPPALAGSALGVTTITNDDPRVYYLAYGAGGLHVHELAWSSLTHEWYHRDLTGAVGTAPKPLDLGAVGEGTSRLAVTTHELFPRVYFLGSVGEEIHVCEYFWDRAYHAWYFNDVTAAADQTVGSSIPRPDPLSPLAATTVDSHGDQRVYYRAQVPDEAYSHIYELAWHDGRWNFRDVTGDGSGAPPDPSSPLATSAAGLLPQVYYQTDHDVHQLAWTPPDHWQDTNLMIEPDWPKAISHSPLSATTGGRISLNSRLVSPVSHGELTFYEDGSFVYKPQAGYIGKDSFTYVANDGLADSAPVTVELDVVDECAAVDGNLVANFCFTEGRRPWLFYDITGQGNFSVSSREPFAGPNSAEVVVNTPGDNIQLYQDDLDLVPNTTYELSFAARSDDGRDMSVHVHKHVAPYTVYGLFPSTVNLERSWKSFTFAFTTPNLADMTDARLRFWFAPFAEAGTVYHIDHVVLRPIGGEQCLPVDGNLVRNFCFSERRNWWSFYDSTGKGSFSVSDSEPFAGTYSGVVVVGAPGDNIQLYQDNLALMPNTTYELSFAARSDDGRDMSVHVLKHADPHTDYGRFPNTVDLEPNWKYFHVTFTTPNLADMKDARLRFWFAPFAGAGTVYHIDQVVLRPLSHPLLALSAGNDLPGEEERTIFRSYLPLVTR